MVKNLKRLIILVAIFLTACGSSEPATSVPAASAPTATHTPLVPTATNLPEPTATPLPEPTATTPPPPTPTPLPKPRFEATTELVGDHDEAAGVELVDEHEVEAVTEVSEPEFTGQAVPAQWQNVEPTNSGPGPRYEHAMQYNAATNQLFAFGGRDGSQVYNDVWALDLASSTWRQIAADAALAPPTRFSAVMIVDAPAENLYVATGQRQDGSVLGDIWRLNLQTETWEDLSSTAGQGPVARYGAAGGNIDNNLVVTHGFGSTRYDDTWLFNTTTGQWENITPAGEVPLKRCLLAAATGVDSLVLHGGCSSGFGPCPQDDTWILDTANQSWRQIAGETRPAGRQHHTLTDMAEQNQMILFGGQDAGRAARNDVWLLDLATESWQPVEAANGPEARYNHQAVWTPLGLLIYGGQNNGSAG